ncbi:MAG: ABC transporter substrate-binding protein [Methylobacter sp.]|nr:MAG: ABC transporter substrate-binding protein [Methylobacter sp.]
MQPQERELLNSFLNQLNSAQAAGKDTEAEAMIKQAVAKQPDAAYLLVQRAMLMNQALESLKAENARLQNQLAQHTSNSFLGGGDPWAAPVTQNRSSGPVPGSSNYQIPHAQPVAGNSAMPSFLGSVATTAAGVVAGSFLFQGIENLMGHHNSGNQGDWMSHNNSDQTPDQTTINNYYASDNQVADNTDHQGYDFVDGESDGYFDDNSGQDSW